MSMVSLELSFPIMESVDRGENTGITEKEESYHCIIPKFMFVVKTLIFIHF